MNLISARPFWPLRDGLPATFPPLEEDVRCDVAIIGGGISGALVAWELAKEHLEVVLLDRREVAHGSTAGSTSLLQYEIDVPLRQLAKQMGWENARRCYQRCGEAIDELAERASAAKCRCEFERKASLLLASSRAHIPRLQREFTARQEAGFEVKWWSRRQIAAQSTLPHPAAIWSKTGAQVDAYRFTYGLLTASAKEGVRIHDRTLVTRVVDHHRGFLLQTDRGGIVQARQVVFASGYEAAEYAAPKLTKLHSTYAIVSEPLDAFDGWPADECLLWDTATPYIYLRTTADRRAIIGGYDEPFRDPLRRDQMLPAKSRALVRRFRQLFPAIRMEVYTAWAGTFAATPDGLPFIGQVPGRPNAWLALGYGGNGITFSCIAARLIADGIMGRKNPDAELFGFERLGKRAASGRG